MCLPFETDSEDFASENSGEMRYEDFEFTVYFRDPFSDIGINLENDVSQHISSERDALHTT